MRIPGRCSTTVAASWTDRERREWAAPDGRAKRVNPRLTAIFEEELVRKYGLFFACCACQIRCKQRIRHSR
ncbi:hypothetical protein DJ535_13085 [Citrobacter murliniae]|uniref:Uncharacterized protein n=1 Tax=Citrobacter murliniae TaxID=67829 RepID=A0ABY2PUF5_9ENTR|nr:hypothetical protein DJ535_13085 [Citrobacter murliniae]